MNKTTFEVHGEVDINTDCPKCGEYPIYTGGYFYGNETHMFCVCPHCNEKIDFTFSLQCQLKPWATSD